MNPRCRGSKAPGHWTGFECVLDEGHDGHCEPFRPPTVDEWRRLCARAEQIRAQAEELMAIIDERKGCHVTTTEQLREYLDKHGVDGAPAEPGWYVAEFANRPVVVCVHREPWGMSFRTGAEHVGSFIFSSSISRHAPLIISQPSGRDPDAESTPRV